METPSIHIKFIPLTKNIVKNNSYNLEIVPVVTSIENIDKIEWKDVNDKVQYTVPITYKIVIIKQNSQKKCVKIYHSCVDIISPTSSLSIKLSVSDIPRPKSEYSILNKKNKYSELKNIVTFDVQLNPKFKQINNIDYNFCKEHKHLYQLKVPNLELNTLPYENFKVLKEITYNGAFNNDFTSSTSTRIMQFGCNEININKDDYNNDQVLNNKIRYLDLSNVDVDKTPVYKTEIKKKLLITPVSNVKTEDKNIPTISLPPHLTGHLRLDYLNDYNVKNRMDTDIQFKVNDLKIGNSKLSKFNARILPEIRVAKFLQDMEMEILPLKIILNNIINKCVLSNVYTLLKNRSSLAKNITKAINNSCDVRNNLKSNRVVYSIVFHELNSID